MAYVTTALPWCSTQGIRDTDSVRSKDVPKVLEQCCQEAEENIGELDWVTDEYKMVPGENQLMIFSVTSKEANHKAWLEAIEGYPGATITEMKRNHGYANQPQYTVHFCCFPLIPELGA